MNHEQKSIQPAVKSSSWSAGILLTRVGLLVLLSVMFLAAWSGLTVVVVLIGLVLSAAGLARLWSRLSLIGVSAQRLLTETRAFPGETIELKLKLSNRKLLPLPWVQIEDEIPQQLLPADSPLPPGERPSCRMLSRATSLLWYTSVSWKQKLYCQRRGYYKLGPLSATSGDIFGWYPRTAFWLEKQEVIIYPRIFPVSQLAVPSLYPMGETQAERRIFEDPTRTIGVRDYTPHDGLRHIHWKASARHQNLQVKVFEPTTTLKVAIFLAVDSFIEASDDIFELGVSTAASLANYLVQKRSQIGLFANSQLADTGQPVATLPGSGMPQLIALLESLAKVTARPSGPFADFFQKEWVRLPWGTTLLFILGKPPEHLPLLLSRLKEAGYKSAIIQVGTPAEHGAPPLSPWFTVSLAGECLEFVPGRLG